VFAVLTILVTRPVPVWFSLLGSGLRRTERLSVAWFGPKGFASVAYAVIVAFSGMPGAEDVLALTTVVVLLSVLAHSSTDVAVARVLAANPRPDAAEDGHDGHAKETLAPVSTGSG
jgi:NhaP-type Na+/H+ or K+/H+ antiporter